MTYEGARLFCGKEGDNSTIHNCQSVSTDTLATAETPQYKKTITREAVFDILKGIGIVEVLLHHCLSHSARKYAEQGSGEWWGLMLANRVLHFAVPLFLLVSALLFARSLAKRKSPDWGRFYDRRVSRTLQPYLVWSLIYLMFRLLIMRLGADVVPATLVLPFGLEITGPALFTDVGRLANDMLWGDAYFHLYFMSVMLQMAIAFPIIFGLLRRYRPSFKTTLLTALGLQIVAFLVQRSFSVFPAPASSLLWYLPPVTVGAWIGLNWNTWQDTWREWRSRLGIAAGVGMAVYLTSAILILSGSSVSSLLYNVSFSLFSTGIALFLLEWGTALTGARIGKPLSAMGNLSLALFLIHPMVMYLLSGPKVSGVVGSLPFSFLWVVLAVTAISYGLVRLSMRVKLDRILFGRALALRPSRASEPPEAAPDPKTSGSTLRPSKVEVLDPVLAPAEFVESPQS